MDTRNWIEALNRNIRRGVVRTGDLLVIQLPAGVLEEDDEFFVSLNTHLKEVQERTGIEFLLLSGDVSVTIVRKEETDG